MNTQKNTTPFIEVKNLTVHYTSEGKEIHAVNDVSFSLQKGETLGLVGETGAGKTTIAKSILRILPEPPAQVDSGRILLEGKDLLPLSNDEMRKIRGKRISMIFQDPMTSLNPLFTVGDQLTEPLRIHKGISKREARDLVLEKLRMVEIPDPESRMKQYPHELSGGMRQRIMIAMAIMCNPRLIIADEPTTALDVTIQAQILELMNDLRHKLGMSIIMITHDLGVVAQMCEKIAVMYAGHIVEYGTTDEIFYNPQHEYTKGLINSIPKLNAEEKERLVPIEGQPVDLLNPPAGCPFAPRCKSCMKVCLNKMPPKTELSDTHYTYCWLRQKEEFEKGGKAE